MKDTKDQKMLIDVLPEDAKPIIEAAREYKEVQGERLTALSREKKLKQKVLGLVKEAKFQPLEGGVIKFECEGCTITVTPRDELVQVKDAATETE